MTNGLTALNLADFWISVAIKLISLRQSCIACSAFFAVSAFYLLLLLVIFFNFWINQLDWHNRNQHAGEQEMHFSVGLLFLLLLSLSFFRFSSFCFHFNAFRIERVFKLLVEIEAPWIMNDRDNCLSSSIIHSPGN